MACEVVPLAGGGVAIVCGSRGKKCRTCKRRATLECDWKVPERKSGTCDEPICTRCAISPAPGKDLCPTHAAAYRSWLARQKEKR